MFASNNNKRNDSHNALTLKIINKLLGTTLVLIKHRYIPSAKSPYGVESEESKVGGRCTLINSGYGYLNQEDMRSTS